MAWLPRFLPMPPEDRLTSAERKLLARLNAPRLSTCLRRDCQNGAIKSHSFQQGGPLKLLVESQESRVLVPAEVYSRDGIFYDFVPTYIGTAARFLGFCPDCDSRLFRAIEVPHSPEARAAHHDEQMFLHALRATCWHYAYTKHRINAAIDIEREFLQQSPKLRRMPFHITGTPHIYRTFSFTNAMTHLVPQFDRAAQWYGRIMEEYETGVGHLKNVFITRYFRVKPSVAAMGIACLRLSGRMHGEADRQSFGDIGFSICVLPISPDWTMVTLSAPLRHSTHLHYIASLAGIADNSVDLDRLSSFIVAQLQNFALRPSLPASWQDASKRPRMLTTLHSGRVDLQIAAQHDHMLFDVPFNPAGTVAPAVSRPPSQLAP